TASQGNPFLQYPSVYWGFHARRQHSSGVTMLTAELLKQYENRIPSSSLLSQVTGHYYLTAPTLFARVHHVFFFGIVEVVAVLIKLKGCKIGQADRLGYAPSMWAFRNGHGSVVKLLLERKDAALAG